MKEKLQTKESSNILKQRIESFKQKSSARITNLLWKEESEIKPNHFNSFMDNFSQLTLEDKILITAFLWDYLEHLSDGSYPYEVLTENLKQQFENNNSDAINNILNLIINEDIFKEDGDDFYLAMHQTIGEEKQTHNEKEIEKIENNAVKTVLEAA